MMKQLLPFLLILLMSGHAFTNEPTNKSSEQLQEIIDLLQSNASEEALSQLRLHESDLVTSVHESKDAEAYMLLGQAYFLAEMDAKAIEVFKSALLLDSSLSEAHFFSGLIHRYADDVEDAEKSFREAIAANDKEEKYFVELGRTLEMKDDLTSASTAYKNALALNETNVDANSSLATIYAIEGNVNSAEKHFIATIEQDPNDLDSQYNLGQLYQNTKQYKLAIKQFEKVVELDPIEWRAIGKLVQLNEAMKDYPARNSAIEAIYDVWRTNKSEELREQKFYIREQSELENGKLFVLEYFELDGDRARKFVFKLQDEDTEEFKFEVSLGSYDATNNYARAKGSIGHDERRYHLDGYAPNGSHFTYAFFNGQPSYEVAKDIALKKLAGDNKSISSTIILKE